MQKRLATACAIAKCEAMRVEKSAIQRVLNEEPFAAMFVAHILARNARI
jgi:CRP/FNR family transcriptional regulator, cyclic AMP receptor protein